jgi:hypothetical protein
MGIKVHGVSVWCPACDEAHAFSGWTFNGDREAPTFHPSMRVRYYEGDPADPASNRVCHSHLVDGIWKYLPDCTHAMAGKDVPAPDWDDHREGYFYDMSEENDTAEPAPKTTPEPPPPPPAPAQPSAAAVDPWGKKKHHAHLAEIAAAAPPVASTDDE